MFHYREDHADNKYLSLSKTNFFSRAKSFFFGEQPACSWKGSYLDAELRYRSECLALARGRFQLLHMSQVLALFEWQKAIEEAS